MKVIVGYGDFENYRIEEIPENFLSQLLSRYKLEISSHCDSDETELLITIAVHEESLRRKSGGKILRKRPSARQLAMKIVSKGFQTLSKDHHPDLGGDEEVQKELTNVRDRLFNFCEEIPECSTDNALIIPDPDGQREAAAVSDITDEDIPF